MRPPLDTVILADSSSKSCASRRRYALRGVSAHPTRAGLGDGVQGESGLSFGHGGRRESAEAPRTCRRGAASPQAGWPCNGQTLRWCDPDRFIVERALLPRLVPL